MAKANGNTVTMTKDELTALIAKAVAEQAAKPKTITVKLTEKGAIGLYGLRRFPIVLYRGEMEAVLNANDKIKAFIAANADKLSTKNAE